MSTFSGQAHSITITITITITHTITSAREGLLPQIPNLSLAGLTSDLRLLTSFTLSLSKG